MANGKPKNKFGRQSRNKAFIDDEDAELSDGVLDDLSDDLSRDSELAAVYKLIERCMADGKQIKEVLQLFRQSLKDIDDEIAVVTKMNRKAKEALDFQHGTNASNKDTSV